MGLAHTGEKNWRWLGGRKKVYMDEYNKRVKNGWAKIRDIVLERDNFTCQICGSKEKLCVHHKIPTRLGINHDLENLITFCYSCHVKEDSKIIKKSKHYGPPQRGN